MKTHATWMRRALSALLLGITAVAVTGCGGSSGGAAPGAGTTAHSPSDWSPAGTASLEDMLARQKELDSARENADVPTEGGPGEQMPPGGSHGVEGGVPLSEKIAPPAPGDTELVVDTPGFRALGQDISNGGPPDTMGAVGPNHVVTMLNTGVLIQDKLGNTVSPAITLEAFFAPLVGANMFDPRVIYNQIHGRWLASANRDARLATSGIGFAISDTDDPTGTWTFYSFDLDAADNNWADFVSMGFNSKWIALTTDALQIGGGFVGEHMWVIDMASALAGGLLTVTQFTPGFANAAGFTARRMKPCVTFDAAEPTLYLASSVYLSGGVEQLRLSRITGTGGAPAWSVVPGSTVAGGSGLFTPANAYQTAGFGLFPGAPQSGGATLVDTGRALLSSETVFRNGHVWLSHTGGLPAAGAVTRTAVFWYQVDPTAMPSPIVQSGACDGGAGVFYYYPSLAVNARDDMCMGFSRSSSTLFVEAVVAGRDFNDPPSTLDPLVVQKVGEAFYSQVNNGRNRWGDYSATCVDPTDDTTIWSLQEYAQTGNTYGTWWARHTPFDPITGTSTLTYPTSAIGATTNVPLNCATPPAPPTVAAECTSSAGAGCSIAFNLTAPSGSAFDVALLVDGVVLQTQTAAGMLPGPSALAGAFMFTLPDGGPYLVEVRADGGGGDIHLCQINVNVVDTTPPTIGACPGPFVVECTGPAGAVVNFTAPSATDVCDASVDVTCVPASGSAFPVGLTMVTCTATDDAGLTDVCMFDVTVQDTVPPVVTASAARSMLFLPRNGMIDVLLSQSATDLCTAISSKTVTVYSSQPNGAAPFAPDAALSGSTLSVRAETLLGVSDPGGRAYLIVVTATDTGFPSANTDSACTWVIVPKTASVQDIIGARNIALAAAANCPSPGPGPAPAATPNTILAPVAIP